ncbi:MAG: carbamoyltransferase HypF [Bacteroidetes bacterium]|jgi:hydrogenase maturation protein HypF|nr:carbamoyltransferase HypF [Bacteroidota bacterium]
MEKRLRITIRGAVQGVGFRPFVYRSATQLGLKGWVVNDPAGVTLEVEGSEQILDKMLETLQNGKPAHSYYQYFNVKSLEAAGYHTFEIRESSVQGSKKVLMQPELATCADCLEEIFDPDDRRYLYPFTNCTHCGPRYSIITGLPYDRSQTTMKNFVMCEVCQKEYEDPENRRFHAQPNACPDCGPHVELWSKQGNVLATNQKAIEMAVEEIKCGNIVALKGLGGFQLLVDATSEEAISRLRKLKNREEKPLALMVSSLKKAREICSISEEEKKLLTSVEAPIVILNRKKWASNLIAASVAPENPTLGIMLPYTPLHHILMRLVNGPVVATSGNLSDEPICIDENEAIERIGRIADYYLVHNRPIERHVDDSVVRMIAGKPTLLRRARGYAPMPIKADASDQDQSQEIPTCLAVGGHLKNTVAVNRESNQFMSQHIGDLDNYEAIKAYHKVIEDLPALYDLEPEWIVHDDHPEYYSTKDALKRNLPTFGLQHHYAHILSCMAEHNLEGPLLGVAWDGTGFGPDETIWGGEFLLADTGSWKRVAAFRSFRLAGGDRAIKEPRRTAVGVLYEIFGEQLFQQTDLIPIQAFTEQEREILRRMLVQNINTHITTSAGRVFDAVASILNIKQKISFEGQAAMALEHLISQTECKDIYSYEIGRDGVLDIIDWEPLFRELLQDLNRLKAAEISAKFHNTLSKIVVDIAKRVGREIVVLSGGCFQNVYLTEKTIAGLRNEGFQPYRHQKIPPNDGGIAAGQLFYALNNIKKYKKEQALNEVPG